MPRIRTVKPELFKHWHLFKAEQQSGLPLRVAFIGLFGCVDREGRFKWRPEELKPDILPNDDLDFADVLQTLADAGFIARYECDGEVYGCIPTFTLHQAINVREAKSVLPVPPVECMHVHAREITAKTSPRRSKDQRAESMRTACACEESGNDAAQGTEMHVHARGEGKGKEGKGSKPKTLSANALCQAELLDPANGSSDDVTKIFAYWRERMNSPKSALSDKRRRLIASALKLHTPADVCKAIRGCSRDQWHMGMNDRGRPFNSIELILRDEKHIEQFIAYDTNPPNPVRNDGPLSKQDRRRRTAEAFGFVPSSQDDSVFDLPPENGHVVTAKS